MKNDIFGGKILTDDLQLNIAVTLQNLATVMVCRLSVCLSMIQVYCDRTTEARIT